MRFLKMLRSSSRRVWRSIRQQQLFNPQLECGSAPVFLQSREYSKTKPKTKRNPENKPNPTTPRQIVLTPALKRTLQGYIKEDDAEEVDISRNEHKRRSERALELGRLLATLLPGQIKNVIRWAGLDERVYEATFLLQKMEMSGLRQGKQMQYRVLKGLLRDSQLDVLEYVVECVRCGETVGIQKVLALAAPEKNRREKEIAEKWFKGLVGNDQEVCREIYAFPLEMFDREELRRLIREFKLKLQQRQKGKAEELELKQQGKVEESEALEKSRRRGLSKSRRMLFRYLEKLAAKTSGEKALVVEGRNEPEAPEEVLLEHLHEKRAEALEILKMKQMTRRERRAYRQSKEEDAEEAAAMIGEDDDEESDAELDEGTDVKGMLAEGSDLDSAEESEWDDEEELEAEEESDAKGVAAAEESEQEMSDDFVEETEEEASDEETKQEKGKRQ